MISRFLHQAEIPLLPANMWGMAYGTLWMAFIAYVSGDRFVIDPGATYIASLLWLVFISSVVAFAAYLTLLRRIGPGRAGYATVMFPVVALAISTALEDYSWTFIAALGVALALFGNFLVLGRPRARAGT